MSSRLLGANYTVFFRTSKRFFVAAPVTTLTTTLSTSPFRLPLSNSTLAMSHRPNYRGGQRRGGASTSGRGGGRRGGGGGGGGRGEQRWWDPVWRAERLRQQAAEVS